MTYCQSKMHSKTVSKSRGGHRAPLSDLLRRAWCGLAVVLGAEVGECGGGGTWVCVALPNE